jgi:hypothetical protein
MSSHTLLNPLLQVAQSCHKQFTERTINAAAEQNIKVDRNTIHLLLFAKATPLSAADDTDVI